MTGWPRVTHAERHSDTPYVTGLTRRVPMLALLTVLIVSGCGSPAQPSTAPTASSSTTAPAVGEPSAQASWTMPSLVGSNLQEAQNAIQKLTGNAIFVTRSHDASGANRSQVLDRNWKVCSQNIPVGTSIDKSTKIDFGAVKLDERCP